MVTGLRSMCFAVTPKPFRISSSTGFTSLRAICGERASRHRREPNCERDLQSQRDADGERRPADLLLEPDDQGRGHPPAERSRNKDLPSELHQPVVANARECGAKPDEDKDDEAQLPEKPQRRPNWSPE